MQALRSMIKYVRKNWGIWLIGLFVPAFASLATNVFYANRLKNYSEQLMGASPSLKSIASMLAVTIIVLLLLSCIDDIGRYIFAYFSASTESELKHDFFGSLIHTSLKDIKRFNKGELITRYNADTAQSSNIVSYDINGVIYPLVVGIGYLSVVLISNLWIGLVMLVLGVGVITFNFLILRKMVDAHKEVLKANEVHVLNCSNAIHGKMSIREYSAKKMIMEKIESSARSISQKERLELRINVLKILTSDSLANICTYLLAPLACVFAVYGYISVPVVLFIHQICRCFIMYTEAFASSFIEYNTHVLSYNRVHSVLSSPDETKERSGCKKNDFPSDKSISFESVNVFFDDTHVLKDVSFRIHPGEIIGLIGESGSGKSTLVKALLQLVDYEGRILIGEKDCAEMPLDVLRSHISLSPEHSDLFHATVCENIRFGNLSASEEKLTSAARNAGISDVETFLQRDAGENGERLSGGQKQKVSMARALLKDAPIIILDEPTAALDANSEMQILNTILALKQEGKSILIITHKMSTLSIADRILQIDKGRVKEQDKLCYFSL